MDAKYSTEAGCFQRSFPNADIIIYGPGDPNGIHKAGEKISGESLLRYQDDFIKLLSDYLEIKQLGIVDDKKLVYNKNER